MRRILSYNKYTSIKMMLNALNFLHVKKIIAVNMLCTIYKVSHKMMPEYLNDKVKYINSKMYL